MVSQIDKLDNPYDYEPKNEERATIADLEDSQLSLVGITEEQMQKYEEYKKIVNSGKVSEKDLITLPAKIHSLGLDIFKSKIKKSTGISKDEITISAEHNLDGKIKVSVEIKDKEYQYMKDKGIPGVFKDSELSPKVASYVADMAKMDGVRKAQRNHYIKPEKYPALEEEEIIKTSEEVLKAIEGIMPDKVNVNEKNITTEAIPKLYSTEEYDKKKVSKEEDKNYKENIKEYMDEEER